MCWCILAVNHLYLLANSSISLYDLMLDYPCCTSCLFTHSTDLSAVHILLSCFQWCADDLNMNMIFLCPYIHFSGGEERFEVDPETGVVRTLDTKPFQRKKEYEIGVSAEDTEAGYPQKSPTHSLKILVGERDPQFFETIYKAKVPETANERFE